MKKKQRCKSNQKSKKLAIVTHKNPELSIIMTRSDSI